MAWRATPIHVIAALAVAPLAIAPRAVAGSSFDAQIGWLTEGCLAVPNGAIEPGALVTFLLFEPERAEGHVPLVGGHSAQGGAELARALEPFLQPRRWDRVPAWV